jgi:PAS domain-containing protein
MQHRAARLTETREGPLTAAETFFSARGFEATSVRDLATTAHCNRAAVHDHRGGIAPRSHAAFSRLAQELRAWRAAPRGDTVAEFVGRSVLQAFDDPDREAVQKQVAVGLEQYGSALRWEVRKACKDGMVLWGRETARAMRRVGSAPVVVSVCEDITESKRAEETCRESEERFRQMADTLPKAL